jgi:hypothetical protein
MFYDTSYAGEGCDPPWIIYYQYNRVMQMLCQRRLSMGASGWSYYTPYQQDIAQALQELRQRVFEAGDYQQYWLYNEVPDEVFEELDELEPQEWRQPGQQGLGSRWSLMGNV